MPEVRRRGPLASPRTLYAGGAALLAIEAVLIFICSRLPEFRDFYRSPLRQGSMLLLEVTLICLGVGFVSYWTKADRTERRRFNVGLGSVIAFGLFLRIIGPGAYRILFDEQLYAHAAQVMAFANRFAIASYGDLRYGDYVFDRLALPREPAGFSFLLAVGYRLFGASESIAFGLNRLAYGLSVVGIFHLGIRAGLEKRGAILAAFFFALSPVALAIGNGPSSEITALALGIWAVLLVWKVSEPRKDPPVLLAIGIAALAFQVRPESALFALPMGMLLLKSWCARNDPEPRRRTAALLVFAVSVLLFGHLVQLMVTKDLSWDADGIPPFSSRYFGINLHDNLAFYWEHEWIHAALGGLAVLGAILGRRNFGTRLLVLWFVAFFALFLFYYCGSYRSGPNYRYSLICLPPICILAANAVVSIGRMRFIADRVPAFAMQVAVVFFLTSLPFARYARRQGEAFYDARASIAFAREAIAALPPDSLVFSDLSPMWMTEGQSAAALFTLNDPDPLRFRNLEKLFPGGLYFDWSVWCQYGAPTSRIAHACSDILTRFDWTAFLQRPGRNYNYTLFRLREKSPIIPALPFPKAPTAPVKRNTDQKS